VQFGTDGDGAPRAPFSTGAVKKVPANVLKPMAPVLLTCLHLNRVTDDEAVQI